MGERRTSVGCLLYSVAISGSKEGIVRKAIKKRSLFHDLVYRVFDRRGIFHVGQRVEVEGNDCDAVGELFWWPLAIAGEAEGETGDLPTYFLAE